MLLMKLQNYQFQFFLYCYESFGNILYFINDYAKLEFRAKKKKNYLYAGQKKQLVDKKKSKSN